jgi:ATP-dependent Clp protease ATP-binding subunit ClpC
MITDLQQRLLAKDIQLKITPSARAWIAEKGFDRLLGARPLKRVVQHEVEDLIAEKVLFNEIIPGQKVTLDRDKKADNLTLKIPQLSTLPETE